MTQAAAQVYTLAEVLWQLDEDLKHMVEQFKLDGQAYATKRFTGGRSPPIL